MTAVQRGRLPQDRALYDVVRGLRACGYRWAATVGLGTVSTALYREARGWMTLLVLPLHGDAVVTETEVMADYDGTGQDELPGQIHVWSAPCVEAATELLNRDTEDQDQPAQPTVGLAGWFAEQADQDDRPDGGDR